MQNKRRPNNRNKGSAYYKSQVRKTNRTKFDFYETSKKRQINSYFKAITVLLIFMAVVSGFIFLGIFLNNLVANENEIGNEIKSELDNDIADEPDINIRSFANDSEDSEFAESAVLNISQTYYGYNGVYLDIRKMGTIEELDQFIIGIKEKGINAVNIDIKTEDGIIQFETENPMAIIVGAVNVNENLPITSVISTLHANDIYVSGTVSCFKDDYASATYPSYSLLKKSDGYRWNDANGNHWLNAYSEEARKYIKEIIVESTKLNFDEIVLSNFFFPNLANPGDLQYGNNASTLDKYDVTTEFVREVREKLNETGSNIKLGINIPIRYFLSIPHEVTGINPDRIIEAGLCDFIVTSFEPSEIPTTINVRGSVIKDAEQNPYNAVKLLCEHFNDYISQIMFRPILQAYDSPDGVKFDNTNINSQKQALFESDIKVWQLLNYDNLY